MAPIDVLSFQLYSARNFPPLESQLRIIAEAGFANVEAYDALYADAAEVSRLIKKYGLTARSGHFALATLETAFDQCIGAAEALGIDILVAPYLAPDARPRDSEGWNALGERLSAIGDRLRRAGHGFAWHNHDFEFEPLPDGSFPIERLLVENVLWEADVAWIVRAGADPKRWIQRYGAIMSLVHVKDIAAQGEKRDEDGWADVGAGIVDWAGLWPLCVEAGAEIMVAEHDNPSDLARFANASAKTMRKLAKA
jgi:sugar phosphate isomerase/epimerase